MSEAICKRPKVSTQVDKRPSPKGEDGFVLITVMLVMVLLLALALAAAESAILETKIAANHQEYTENFYAADGAAMEGAQVIANELDSVQLNPATSELPWLDQQKPADDPAPASDDKQPEVVNTPYDDPTTWDPATWQVQRPDKVAREASAALSDDGKRDVRQMAVATTIDSGSSKRLNSPDRVTVFLIYGFSQAQSGKGGGANVAIGYGREND